MKKYLFILLLSFIAGGAFAQTHKVTIYSSFYQYDCSVNYTDYDKLYPDSIKTAVMIDYQKKYQLNRRNSSVLLLRMNQDGWKLISVFVNNGRPEYLMSKEILLDDTAMNLYLQNLNSLSKGKNDVLPFL
jgi:hypothetical protein